MFVISIFDTHFTMLKLFKSESFNFNLEIRDSSFLISLILSFKILHLLFKFLVLLYKEILFLKSTYCLSNQSMNFIKYVYKK